VARVDHLGLRQDVGPTDASGPVVLFSDTEVLLDNQAGRSVFRNARLLTDTRRLERPICIGGVDESSKGIRVETDGDFEDLGRVGISGHAAANILSKAEMVDAGHRISYVNDEYHLAAAAVAAETQQEESQEQERALGVDAQSPAAEASRSPRAKSRPAPAVGASRRAIYRRTAPTTAMRRQESWLPSARTTTRMMTSMMSR
jgi:hypothetical protein